MYVLTTGLDQSQGQGEKACDECVKSIGAKENCTKREEMKFCSDGPGPTPGPVSDICETILHAVCDASVSACAEGNQPIPKQKRCCRCSDRGIASRSNHIAAVEAVCYGVLVCELKSFVVFTEEGRRAKVRRLRREDWPGG
eukprot:SAG11_NODE_372_length_10036_cov_8.820871_3_plen_141_part_00